MSTNNLPKPTLTVRESGGLRFFTDDALLDACGVRIAFTWRIGGLSEGEYSGLDLATHVGDDEPIVLANRKMLLDSLGATDVQLIVPNQVHGDELVVIDSSDEQLVEGVRATAAEGADGIIVTAPDVAALLCFADCVPVIIVSPSGSFAVVHAGWRGVMARIAPKAVRLLEELDSLDEEGPAAKACSYNVYIGPHIHVECFETSSELAADFVREFGRDVAPDPRHVDLLGALRSSLIEAGISSDRITDSGACTVCRPDDFYSYRASGGTCGRHGAIAFRMTKGQA